MEEATIVRTGTMVRISMPTVSRFFGIAIRMYFDDHRPPHFHAYYGEYAETIDIETLTTREGKLPRRARALVLEWAAEHREELLENWQRSEAHEPLQDIEPLE
jgi:Domain of unknown function (DUF4160)